MSDRAHHRNGRGRVRRLLCKAAGHLVTAAAPTRLDAALRRPASTADGMLESIVGSVRAFRAGQPAADDETCLVAAVTPVEQSTQGRRRASA